MLLESKWIEKIRQSLIGKGYTQIERGLVVFGGKDNGTVDLMATNTDKKESIIIEIKNNPIDLLDLSQYIRLKRNIEAHKGDLGILKFYIISCRQETSESIKKMAKDRGIIIDKIEKFIEKINL
ncbi:DUF91 domain-containing protein [Candidatus Pacearchaeota archaeon]|nr:DUF91 domain-containing protein [Candidatus Pacearchaeota archaeon]